MSEDESSLLLRTSAFIEFYFLPLSGLGIGLGIVVDEIVADGSYIVEPTLAFAQANEAPLSVIISGLLLFAYLMQYQNQRIQRGIMDRQVKLMKAGYTPILGVSSRKWGAEKRSTGDDLEIDEANRLFLELSNSGNSTARDLRVWTGLSYEASPKLDSQYCSYTVPLRRTSDASWWQTDEGGALARSDGDTTEFKADPSVRKVEKGWWKINPDISSVLLHSALEDLEEAGIRDVKMAFVLQYTTTTGEEEEIYLGAYKADLTKLANEDMRVYRAMEIKEEQAKAIREEAK